VAGGTGPLLGPLRKAEKATGACMYSDKGYQLTSPFKKSEAFFFFKFLIFIVAPCVLISSKSFIYQQMHFISVLENIKIHNKTYIKIAPTCFGLRPSSWILHTRLAKVTCIKSVKVCCYGLCGCVAACCHTTT